MQWDHDSIDATLRKQFGIDSRGLYLDDRVANDAEKPGRTANGKCSVHASSQLIHPPRKPLRAVTRWLLAQVLG